MFFLVTGEAEKEVDFEQYFQTAGPLHCTTKFCDYGKVDGAKEYAELEVSFPHFFKSYTLFSFTCGRLIFKDLFYYLR